MHSLKIFSVISISLLVIPFVSQAAKNNNNGISGRVATLEALVIQLQNQLDDLTDLSNANTAQIEENSGAIAFLEQPLAPEIYTRMADQVFINAEDPIQFLTVYCDEGDVPTGGGFWQWQAGQSLDEIQILESSPTGAWDDQEWEGYTPKGGWQIRAKYTGEEGETIISAVVQCRRAI